jgi:hypothetical protein
MVASIASHRFRNLMIQTYLAAISICAASLLVGNALLALVGWRSWSWLEPGVGFAALMAGGGVASWASGNGTAVAATFVVLLVAAAAVSLRRPRGWPTGRWQAAGVAALLLAALALPFAVAGHWEVLGDQGIPAQLHGAEWLQGTAARPAADGVLGPESVAVAVAMIPGVQLEQAFLGELFAVAVLSGLTALGAVGHLDPARRTLAASMVALAYLSACFFALAAIRTTAEALFVLTVGVALLQVEWRMAPGESPGGGLPGEKAPWRTALPPAALAAGVIFSNGVVGLLWPAAIVARWSLNRPAVRRALRPRSLLALLRRPGVVGIAVVILASLALLPTSIAPFSLDRVAATNLGAPVSPIAALGIWPHESYPLEGAYEFADWAAAVVAATAVFVALLWWLRRREAAVPVAFGVSSVIYLLQPLFEGQYTRAQALAIVAPVAMLVAVRPLLEETGARATPLRRVGPLTRRRASPALRRFAWTLLATAFIGAAAYSSWLALAHPPPCRPSPIQAAHGAFRERHVSNAQTLPLPSRCATIALVNTVVSR